MKAKKAITIIGEGVTEKYYIESLKNLSPFSITPKELGKKASSLKTLEQNIKNAIDDAYDEIYCLIDMDDKNENKTKYDYKILKDKYHDKIFRKPSKGIMSKVIFIETERCLELWFLFHFSKNITKKFNSYKDLEFELRKFRPKYEKTEKYFKTVLNIHNELTLKAPKGSLKVAVENSISSIKSMVNDERTHTYSNMHLLIEALNITF